MLQKKLFSYVYRQGALLSNLRLSILVALCAILLLTLLFHMYTHASIDTYTTSRTMLTRISEEQAISTQLVDDSLAYMRLGKTPYARRVAKNLSSWQHAHTLIWAQAAPMLGSIPFSARYSYFALNNELHSVASYKKMNGGEAHMLLDSGLYFQALQKIAAFFVQQEQVAVLQLMNYQMAFEGALGMFLLFETFSIFIPAIKRLLALSRKVTGYAEELEQTQLLDTTKIRAMLEEKRQTQEVRAPVLALSDTVYRVQNGAQGFYDVVYSNSGFSCPCAIFAENRYCLHVKLVKNFIRQQTPTQDIMWADITFHPVYSHYRMEA